MKPFAVLPLGMGEFFSRKYYNSNLLLRLGDRLVQVDCPAPYRRMLGEATAGMGVGGGALDYGDIDDVIITHLHGDHSNGLEGLLLWRFYKERKKTRIHTSPEVIEDLWNKLRGSMSWATDAQGRLFRGMALEDYAEVVEWPAGSRQELAGAVFETRRTDHSVPTFGFRVSFEGRSFGYSCDTRYNEDYVRWLGECDFVIHECNAAPPHTQYEQLLGVDPAIRAKMALIHVGDEFDVAGSAIRVVEQGRWIEIGG
jgi:ribonuclease BN (tRNA processing enzyme)